VFGLSLQVILGLSAIGTLITVAGSFIATWLTSYVFVRSFEKWKARQALFNVYCRYRDPIILAALELCHRMDEILKDYSPSFLNSDNLKQQIKFMTIYTAEDLYFQQYKLISTIYRFCAFLGWLELYRQEVTFLDSGRNRVNLRLESCINHIREDLADGQINMADDWNHWKDGLIFREEQRAIGDAMICGTGQSRSIMGYGSFYKLLDTTSGTIAFTWIEIVQEFLCNHGTHQQDFREARFRRLVVHLIDLIELLDHDKMTDKMKKCRFEQTEKLEKFYTTPLTIR